MLKDKLKATDWETTDETMIEIVARESYLQWLKENQRKENQRKHQAQVSTRVSTLWCVYLWKKNQTVVYYLICLWVKSVNEGGGVWKDGCTRKEGIL